MGTSDSVEIVLTRGLPASGKSTWARSWVAADPSSRVRVNRDDIRFQLYGAYWGENVDEYVVTQVERAMVAAAVEQGKCVVIDATHLRARNITEWRKVYPRLVIQDFELPLDKLVSRDKDRALFEERWVGERVIRDMAQRFQIKADGKLPALPEPPEPEERWALAIQGDVPAIIVDIDGTLANHTGVRGPYDTSRYHLDTVHADVADIVSMLQVYSDLEMIVVSGRDEAFRSVTLEWLNKQGINPNYLFMRPEGDKRNDAIIKHEIYHENIAGIFDVKGVFDDRGRVLRMWRAIGLTTFAVGDTDNYNF